MAAQHPPNRHARPLVLIVDAQDETLALYALALSAMGFDVVPARSCEEAYTRAAALHPDIIVTEVPLASGSGWDLMERLKRDSQTRDIPVAVLTGRGEPSSREHAVREGCAVFLLKPFPADTLASTLRDVLARA